MLNNILPVVYFIVLWEFKCYYVFSRESRDHPEWYLHFRTLLQVLIICRGIQHSCWVQ